MKSKTILILLTFFFILACKKEEKKNETENTKVEVPEFFSVELDVITQKEDNFAVYFTEDNTINFSGENALWSGVLAQETTQKVKVNFPEQVIPTNIRIDFGINKEQSDIVLEKFKLNYYGKSFEANGSEFLKYFIPNDSIKTEIDETKGTIKFLINSKSYNTPYYYPQQAILDEIIKITKS